MMRSTALTVRLPGVSTAPVTSTRTWSHTGAVKKSRKAAIRVSRTGGTIPGSSPGTAVAGDGDGSKEP